MKKIFSCKECNNKFSGRTDSKNLFCSHKCARSYTGLVSKIRNEILKNINVEIYNLNPKKCIGCGYTIPYPHRINKFCSQSCGAQHTNKKRYENGFKMSTSARKNLALINHKKSLVRYNNSPKSCAICNQNLTYEKRNKKTCSQECLKAIARLSGQKGGLKSSQVRPRRSKNEIAMYELCKSHFKNVTHNDSIFNGWDADILLHDYKIAILWNGDWHYQEMNCYNHSLKQVQTRDKHKSKLIKEAGWIEYIIKDTTSEPTTPTDAFNVLLKYINEC